MLYVAIDPAENDIILSICRRNKREGIRLADPYIDETFTQDIIVSYIRGGDRTDVGGDHFHDFYEVYYYLGNSMNYFIDEKKHSVQNNDIVLIAPYLIHRTLYTPEQKRDRLLILFRPALLDLIADQEVQDEVKRMFQKHRKLTIISHEQQKRFEEMIFTIAATEEQSKNKIHQLQLKHELLSLLLMILGIDQADRIFDHELMELSQPEQLVQQVLIYINNHYSQNINLEEIASKLFVSKYYLSRTFNDVMDTSITKYINTKRLSEAERLIRYSNLTITQICKEVGFSSSSYFIQLFKEKYNCTPLAFRDRMPKKDA